MMMTHDLPRLDKPGSMLSLPHPSKSLLEHKLNQIHLDFVYVSARIADVKKALSARGLPKIRVIWGTTDRYLDDAPIYDWCADIRASFSSMRKVGHMPQEDFPTDAAARCAEFFTADLRASAKAALNSVRVGKITTDDGTG